MKSLVRLVAVTLTVIASIAATIGSAHAASGSAHTTSQAIPRTTHHTLKLIGRVTGFNAAIAKRNGYQFRTDASGREYSVRVGASSTVKPMDITGSCGDGYLEYYAIGNKQAMVFSGWNLFGSNIGVSFNWNIAVVDNAGVGSRY